ncbi:hypothetical protein [Tissierella simiarum]|nr:hypothetical protein [Tissierella simiarum]
MTKGRKTILEEKLEITIYCIEDEHNYQMTAEIYSVSYPQVYQ